MAVADEAALVGHLALDRETLNGLIMNMRNLGLVHTARDMQLSMGKLVLRQAGYVSQTVVGFDKAASEHWHQQVGRTDMQNAGFLETTSPETATLQESEWAKIGSALACGVPTHGKEVQSHGARCAKSQAWEG